MIKKAHFVAAVCLMAASTQAAVYLDEHFDGYANQTAFQSIWSISGTASTTLNSAQSVSQGNSVEGLTTATRNALSIGEVGFLNGTSDTVVFRFNFYDSAGSASAYRQYAEVIDGAGTASGQLVGMGLNNTIASTYYMARILGADGGAGLNSFFKLDGAGAPTRSTGWHSLEADISDTSVSFLVDGILSKTVDVSGVTDRSFDTVRVGSNLSSTQVAYYDDLYVERYTVPEPSVAGFGALGVLGLLLRRRKTNHHSEVN